MRRTGIIVWFVLVVMTSEAQQDARFSQYAWNNFLFNPAYAGLDKTISVSLYNQNNWISFPGAPVTRAFTIQSPFNHYKNGIGLKLIDESSETYRNSNLSLAYSYKINLSSGVLSFGIDGGFNYYALNLTNLSIRDLDDQVLSGATRKVSTDISTGLFYKRKRFYIGFAARHLTQPKLSDVSSDDSRIKRNYYISVKTDLTLSSSVVLTPAFLVKYIAQSKPLAEAGAYISIGPAFWTGAFIRTNKEISGQLGMNVNKLIRNIREDLRIGYAYDFGFSNLYRYNLGTHEIMLLYNFTLRPNPDKILKGSKSNNPIVF